MKEVQLANGKGVALVDDNDYDTVSRYKWCLGKHGGVHANALAGDGSRVYLHRFIMQPKPDELVDHINHNTLDNQRANLRIATFTQNHANRLKKANTSSQYKGVCWDKAKKRWLVGIKVNSNRQHLGRYDYELEAALAYDAAARFHFGEFALTNFNRANLSPFLHPHHGY